MVVSTHAKSMLAKQHKVAVETIANSDLYFELGLTESLLTLSLVI